MRPGLQTPQRVTNSHRAGSPQICAIFSITPISCLLSVRNTVHSAMTILYIFPQEKTKGCPLGENKS